MAQTRAQRAASLRNLKKARTARGGRRRRRGGRRRTRRATARRRRRSNPRYRRRNPAPGSMPVVLVNPTRRRAIRRRSRRRPVRRRRRYTGVSGYTRRLPNPTTTWGGALATAGLGGLGGLLAGGFDWGADYIPGPAWGQALALLGAGAVTSVGLAKLADTRIGAGCAGGTSAILVGRLRQVVALARLGKPEGAANGNGQAAAVIRSRGAGAVGGPGGQRTTPMSMRVSPLAGRTYKRQEAGASYYLRQPARRYGPQSWINQPGARAVYVSAHNTR